MCWRLGSNWHLLPVDVLVTDVILANSTMKLREYKGVQIDVVGVQSELVPEVISSL